MSQTISFDEVPADWRVPGTYTEIKPDRRRQGAVPYPARTLLVAPRLAAGLGVLGTPLPVTRLEQVIAWAGAGSVAAEMAAAFIANNRTGAVSLLLLADPAGARASCTVTLGGAPTASGTVTLLVNNIRVSIPVSAGETVATLATRLNTALGANANLPVTSAAAAAVVTLTARHFGTLGNAIQVSATPDPTVPLPAGLTLAVTAMAGGTGEADYAGALPGIATAWWTDCIFPQLTPALMAALPAELDRRWNAMTRLDMQVWAASSGSFGALSTAGNARNGRFICDIGYASSASPVWAWAAALGARCTFSLLNDPARQLRGLPLVGIAPPPEAGRFTDTERDLLLRDGVSTFTVTDDGQVVLERVITQYQRTPLGVEDTAYLDVMRVKVTSRVRYDWNSYMTATWPRAKLADDDAPAAEYDPEVATARRLHGSWAARCTLYERMGWIEGASQTAADSVFVRDVNDSNRVNARLYVRVLGNLMVLAGSLEFQV